MYPLRCTLDIKLTHWPIQHRPKETDGYQMEKDQAGIKWQEGERRGSIDRMIVLLTDTVLQVAELGPRVLQDQRLEGRKRNIPIATLSISCLVKSGR